MEDRKKTAPVRIPAFLLDTMAAQPESRAVDPCSVGCESCLSGCQGTCLMQCQNACQISCVNCQAQCQWTVQGCTSNCERFCLGCQSACEKSSQGPSKPGAGSISIASKTATSITVQLAAIPGADYYVVVYRLHASTAVLDQITTTVLTHTFYGLTPNTPYTFNYYGVNSGGTGPYASGVTGTTLSARPENWSWWSAVGSNQNISLSAGEWNAFCVRINEFREYKGLAQYGAFVTARPGTNISASIVNHAVWAIGAMVSGAYSLEVRPGDTITAGFFNGLKDYLNSV